MVHYSDGNDPGFPVVCHGADAADKVIVDLQHIVDHEPAYSGPYHRTEHYKSGITVAVSTAGKFFGYGRIKYVLQRLTM